jgi:hypothetical protein
MSVTKITTNELLEKMESAEKVLVYEYYDGLRISFGGETYQYLIETEEYVPQQYEIFETIKDLEGLKEFEYTSRFPSELYYDSLTVNENLKTLHLSHMENIYDIKQLGKIENLHLDGFKIKWLNFLPKTLKKIEVSSLDVESEEENNIVIEYFRSHDIEYYFDDYCDWMPDKN